MALVQPCPHEALDHPLDAIEGIALVNDWSFERQEDEIVIEASGNYITYSIAFNWMEALGAIHIAASFEFKPPAHRRAELERLLLLINEQLWLGHFDAWKGEGLVMFRHAHVLGSQMELKHNIAQSLIQSAIDSCDQFYTAFQHVAWSDCSANKAIQSVLFETVGEA